MKFEGVEGTGTCSQLFFIIFIVNTFVFIFISISTISNFFFIPFVIIYYNWIKRQRFRGGYLYRECSKYQLIFLAAEEVLSKPFLSWLKKTASLFHSSTLRVFVFVGRRCFLFFYFFNWLSVHFRKYSDAQLTKGSGCQGMVCFSTASLRRRLHAFPPPPTPTVHSNYKSNMADRINDRELITLARPNKKPALQAGWFFISLFRNFSPLVSWL